MEYLLDISIVVLLIVLGFNVPNFFASADNNDRKTLKYLWLFHLVIATLFFFYVSANGGDAISYWETVKLETHMTFMDYFSLGFGTYFMFVLNYFPSKVMELSFFTGSMIYAFIGFLGFIYFYLLFKRQIKFNSRLFGISLFPAIFFLPNLHFWTAGVGKDAILFFCIAMFFYGIQDVRKNLLKLMLSLLLAYFLRPHIAAFLIMAYAMGVLLDGNMKVYIKGFFLALIVVAFVLFFDSIMGYLRIESLDFDTLSSYSDEKISKLSRGHTGSSVDISQYPFPLKVFTFLYRPFFFDINGVLAILASLENLILLILTIQFFRSYNPVRLFINSSNLHKSILIFFLLGTISFSMILGNLGIMLRQKNMFIPCLLFLCLWGMSKAVEKEMRTVSSETSPLTDQP